MWTAKRVRIAGDVKDRILGRWVKFGRLGLFSFRRKCCFFSLHMRAWWRDMALCAELLQGFVISPHYSRCALSITSYFRLPLPVTAGYWCRLERSCWEADSVLTEIRYLQLSSLRWEVHSRLYGKSKLIAEKLQPDLLYIDDSCNRLTREDQKSSRYSPRSPPYLLAIHSHIGKLLREETAVEWNTSICMTPTANALLCPGIVLLYDYKKSRTRTKGWSML